MNNFLGKIKYRLTSPITAMRLSNEISDRLFSRYLGHNKIIAWREGPVYSTFVPTSSISVFANKMSTFIMQVLRDRPSPHLANIAVTDVCNSKCSHCSFFIDERSNEYNRREKRELLSTKELSKLIKDTLDMGVTMINFVGGEPLLRKDLIPIIRSIDKKRADVSIFTNGWFLKQKVKDLKKAGIASVKVSIDSASPEEHDKRRNHPGLFRRAVQGIIAAKKEGLLTAISCCLTAEDIRNGSVQQIAELGKKLKVNEIIIFNALPSGRLKETKLSSIEVDEIMRIIKPYNKSKKYPGIISYAYLSSFKSMGCAGGTSYFYVSPYGDVSPCDFHPQTKGNIREMPLDIIWQSFTSNHLNKCAIHETDLIQIKHQ